MLPGMGSYVYVLRSPKDGKTCTGCAGDLDRRLWDHARGHVRSTRNRRPLVLVHPKSSLGEQARWPESVTSRLRKAAC